MLTSTTWKLSCIIYPKTCNKNQIAIQILWIVDNTSVLLFFKILFLSYSYLKYNIIYTLYLQVQDISEETLRGKFKKTVHQTLLVTLASAKPNGQSDVVGNFQSFEKDIIARLFFFVKFQIIDDFSSLLNIMSPKRHEQTLLNFCYVGIV